MTAVFITGTGTELGKTFVAAGLIRALRREGHAVEALKPIVTGFDPADAKESDPARLLAAMEQPAPLDAIARIAPWRYGAALSPDMAARVEGRALDVEAVIGFCRDAIAHARGMLVIEGVGGIMVPLDERRTVLDWMTALRLPVVLVTGSYLGTLSHTLTALDVLARRALAVAAIVVSESAATTVPLGETLRTLEDFARDVPVLAVPRLAAETDHPAFAALARILAP
jgi:dethiobiotin synthetase